MKPLKTAAALLVLLLATAPPLTLAQAPGVTAVDSIAAVVDEDVILRSEVELAINNIVKQYSGQPGQLPPRDVLEKQVLERLVMMRLQLARAEATGIRISEGELGQAVQGVANQNRMTADQLRTRLESEGITYEEFRKGLREEMTIQRLRQRLLQSRVQVSETEVDQLLAVRAVGGPEVRLGNILVALPDGATPEQLATAQKKIEGIKDLLDRGEIDFKAAAIRYSDAQNALEGGEIGWRSYDAIPPVFVGMIQAMKPGEVSQPVRGASGYQLIQLMETRDAGTQTVTQYNALGILVRVTETTPNEVARQKAEQARDRILAGEDFGKVALEMSDDTMNRAKGGDMGWFLANDWGTSIGNAIQAMADGELSQPFLSDVGWHVLKRLGTREQDVTEQNRRNQAREIITQRKAEEEYERYIRQLRAESYVESRLGKS